LHNSEFEGMWATCKGYDINEQTDIHIQIQPEDIEVMQFTGLLDKEGKEIYEGDLIYAHKNKGKYEVKFGEYSTSDDDGSYDIHHQGFYLLRYFNGVSAGSEPLGKKSNENLKVIGNIHENHELLEAE